MPIKGLTDRDSIRPRLARLGKLRKGGEKTSNNKPGKDLDHFRPDMNDDSIQEAFTDAYGKEPRLINTVLFYERLEENFSTWIEAWDASGLVMRSDGEHWRVWREGDTYKRGKKPHRDVEGQTIVGRFEFVVPELLQSGFVGTVTLETHSNHDLRNISSVLLAAEQERGTLRGAQFVMRRVREEISVPGWGDRKGQRSKAEKWLVKIEPPRQMFGAMLSAPQRQAALPDNQAVVNVETGEIVELEQNAIPASWDEEDPRDPQDDAPGLRYAPAALRDAIQKRVEERRNDAFSYGPRRRGFVTAVISNLESCTDGDATDFRHVVSWYLTGKDSSKDWDDAEVCTLHKWLNAAQDENEVWHVDTAACREAHAVYAEAQRDLGQAELFEDPERPFAE